MKRTVLLLGVALLLSLGLNALQWIQADTPAPSGDTSAADSVVVSATNEEPEETGCWVELAECRADAVEASEELVRVFTHHTSPTTGEASSAQGGGAPAPPREVGDALQEEVLCTVALEHLRRDWEHRRRETIADLRRALDDEEERGEMRERDVSRAVQLFDVPDAEREDFEGAYRALWDERVSDLREALAENPPDSRAAFAVAQSLFEDEDALAARLFGEEGRRRLRVAQAERRTVVLALLAAHADIEWDDSITW